MISFIKGFFDVFVGLSLILQPGVKRFVLVPVVINVGLFATATILLIDQLDIWIEQLLPGWLNWLEWLIWPLFAISMLLIVFYSFTILANLVAAPFNSMLSAKIETILTKNSSIAEKNNSEPFIRLFARTLLSELKKILYAIKWFVLLIILTFIPVLNIISPFLWILFAAWFFSLEYTEYPLANRGDMFPEVKKFNRDNRMRSLGLGTAIFILTSIPFINFFVMPISVAGATKLTTDINQS